MHHRILPIPCKPYTLNWLPERLIVSHYENNYGAAVRSLNAVRDRLAGIDPTASIAAEIRALKREELSAMASVVLHELYFANLSGGGKVPGEMMTAALEEHFGGVDRWRREFVGAAQSLAGRSGWVVLSYLPHEGRLDNQIALEDAQAIPGAVPILVLDMYEHAYHLEFGANATAYVDAFMRLIEWTVVTERLTQATAEHQRRGSQASDKALPSDPFARHFVGVPTTSRFANSVTESALVHRPIHPPVKVLSSWSSRSASFRYAWIFGPWATTRILCHSPSLGSVTFADAMVLRLPFTTV
jgi:Fe-Mn family superoxide dismutase